MKIWRSLALGMIAAVGLVGSTQADLATSPTTSSPVVLSLGERVELKMEPNGASEVSRGVGVSQKQDYRPSLHPIEELQPFKYAGPKPKAGAVIMTLTYTSGVGTRLKVENGYDYPIIYRAALVMERDGKPIYRPTSICPVLGHVTGFETWPQPVKGIVVMGFQGVGPGHMECNDGSALVATSAPQLAIPTHVCSSGAAVADLAPVSVTLEEDAAGGVHRANAHWTLSRGKIDLAPMLTFDYPLAGSEAARAPAWLTATVFAKLDPAPAAKTAEVVLRLDGVEVARRPWRSFAKAMADPADPKKRALAIAGTIPFNQITGQDNTGIEAVLFAAEQPGKVLQIQVVGDDGVILSTADFQLGASPLRSRSVVEAALAAAKAKPLDQCQKLTN